jgi:hypothetical protein
MCGKDPFEDPQRDEGPTIPRYGRRVSMSWLSYDGSLPSENIPLRKDDQRRKTHHKPQRRMIQPSGCNKFPNGLEGEILSREPPSSDGGSRNRMTKGALAPNEYPSPGRKLNREKSSPLAWDRIPKISFGIL